MMYLVLYLSMRLVSCLLMSSIMSLSLYFLMLLLWFLLRYSVMSLSKHLFVSLCTTFSACKTDLSELRL